MTRAWSYAKACVLGACALLAAAMFDDEAALELQQRAAEVFGGEL